MEYDLARDKLIDCWGALGTNWGISRTVAQIHALLMVSPKPLTSDQIIEELKISRGNVSMSLKTLMGWGIVQKHFVPGERKEYFASEKDVWKLATQIAKERRKRELEPVIEVLKEVQEVENASPEQIAEFNKMSKDLLKFATQCDSLLGGFIKAENSKFLAPILKLMK